jgi:hypothetical protein
MGREVTTTLRINLPVRDYQVKLMATSVVPDQIVSVYVNNQRVANLPIGTGWNAYAFDLPAAAASSACKHRSFRPSVFRRKN